MLPSLFKEKEEVQVLDEVTYNWEAARILGFISNWGVSVKWTEGSTRTDNNSRRPSRQSEDETLENKRDNQSC